MVSLVKFYRMKDWRAYFSLGFLGFIVAQGYAAQPLDIIIFVSVVILLLAFGFSVNNFFDIKEDNLKIDERSLVSRSRLARTKEIKKLLIQNKKTFFLSTLPGVLAIFLSTYFGKGIFLFILISALIGFFYSAPPLRLKSRPFLDLISHGFFAGALIFFFPLLVFKQEMTIFHYSVAFSIFYLSVMLEMRNHWEDYGSDFQAGLRTTACFLGYKKSENLLRYLAIFYPLALFPAFFLLPDRFSFSFLFLTCFFLLLFFIKRSFPIIDTYYAVFSYILIGVSTFYL